MFKKSLCLISLTLFAGLTFFLAIAFSEKGFSLNKKTIEIIKMPEVIVLLIGTLGSIIATFTIHVLTRNKIADISIIGVSSINYLSVTLLYAFLSVDIFIKVKDYILPAVYFISSFGLLLIIFILTYKFRESAIKIILTGIVFSISISALSNMIVLGLDHNKQMYLSTIMIGKITKGYKILKSTSMISTYMMLGASIGLFILFSKPIKILYTNIELAQSIGIRIKFIRFILFSIVSLGSSVAFVSLGPISFIGFISTNIIYLFYKKTGILQLTCSLLIGISLMFIVYIFKYTIISGSIPIGIATNIIAVPYLIFVLWKGDTNDR